MVQFKQLFIILLVLFFAGNGLKSQDQFDVVLESSITRVNQLLDSSNVFLLQNSQKISSSEMPGFLYLSDDLVPERKSELSEQYYELKKKYLTSDLGIRFTGNYNNNLNGGFAEDEDIYYNQRTYLGVEWNVLKTGSIGNRKKISSLENEKELDFIELKEESIKNEYLFTRQYVVTSFVQAQIPYLEQRLQVLWGLFDIYQELFYLKRVEWEKLLVIKGEIKKVELLIRRNRQILSGSGFQSNELLNTEKLPVYGINNEHLLNGLPFEKFDSLKYALKSENLDQSYDTYLDQVSVRPYVRYNFYDFLSYNARSYPSAGITLNVPVMKNSGKKALANVEKQLLNEAFKQDKDQLYTELLNLSRQYEDELQDFVYLVYQRDLLKERINRELKKREINLLGFNGVKALSYFDEFLDYEARILDSKKRIYLRLLDVCYVSKGENPETYLEQLGYDLSFKNFPGMRSVYLWSGLFNVMSNDHLIHFMTDREINNVLVSVGKLSKAEKLNRFLELTAKNGINVLGLVGNNSLVNHNEKEITDYLDGFKVFGLKALHLDVEPHTFNDFHGNEDAYLNKLMKVYDIASAWCKSNGMELSVSVPYHYPHEFLDKVFDVCDHVYIMNYNAKNEQQIIKRLNGFIKPEYQEKLVVSLRLSDFTSLKDLDYSLLHVAKNTGVQNFCFNDLRGLNRMTGDLMDMEGAVAAYKPYRVEVGSFKSEAAAKELSGIIKKMDYNGQISWKRNGTYCVVLGYFNNFDAALDVLNQFAERRPDLPNPWIYMVY